MSFCNFLVSLSSSLFGFLGVVLLTSFTLLGSPVLRSATWESNISPMAALLAFPVTVPPAEVWVPALVVSLPGMIKTRKSGLFQQVSK